MPLFKRPSAFKNQDYDQLKKEQEARHVQFVDDEFEVDSMHILIEEDKQHLLEFLRPSELSEYPCLLDETSRKGLVQGFVTNFNITLVFSCLRQQPKLLAKLFPDSRSQVWKEAAPKEHTGIFKVRFWQDGMEIDVVVDDRLPCLGSKPICLRSSSAVEFWPCLLEKAYAKLIGGYDKLEHVKLEEAAMDLTGGVVECISFLGMDSQPPMRQVALFDKFQQTLQNNALIAFSTGTVGEDKLTVRAQAVSKEAATNGPVMEPMRDPSTYLREMLGAAGPANLKPEASTGLCSRYGYLLTRTCSVPKDISRSAVFKDFFRRKKNIPIQARLVRLRCPLSLESCGTGLGEWKGAYSQSSKEWEAIDEDARRRLDLIFESETEFWMPFEAVLQHMVGAVVCLIPDIGLISLTGPTWQLSEYHGAWHGHQAGGDLRFLDTFVNNPQFYFDLPRGDAEEVLIALVRKYERDPVTLEVASDEASPLLGIGLFKVESNRCVRIHNLARTKTIHVESAQPHRVAFLRQSLSHGRYVVIPFLDEPTAVASYLLRLYLPKRTESKELLLDIPQHPVTNFFYGEPKQAIRIHIHRASHLAWLDGKNPPSPYCTITCEGETAKTAVLTGTDSPVWDDSFVFFQRNPRKASITVEIMDKRTLGADGFLGRHCFDHDELKLDTYREVVLFGRDTKEERFQTVKGTLFVELFCLGEQELMQI